MSFTQLSTVDRVLATVDKVLSTVDRCLSNVDSKHGDSRQNTFQYNL